MKKSFPFEYESWIAGTAFLNRREKGAYMDLLCIQAGKGRLTMEMIKDILNGDFECWEKIKGKFTEDEKGFYNKKLESVINKHKKTEEEICIEKAKAEQIIKDKKQKFYEDCKPFLSKYPKEMLREFYNYWTEMNKSGTRLRFELQQTFEISKRLATWANKTKDFIKEDKLFTHQEMLALENKTPGTWRNFETVKQNGIVLYKHKE